MVFFHGRRPAMGDVNVLVKKRKNDVLLKFRSSTLFIIRTAKTIKGVNRE